MPDRDMTKSPLGQKPLDQKYLGQNPLWSEAPLVKSSLVRSPLGSIKNLNVRAFDLFQSKG